MWDFVQRFYFSYIIINIKRFWLPPEKSNAWHFQGLIRLIRDIADINMLYEFHKKLTRIVHLRALAMQFTTEFTLLREITHEKNDWSELIFLSGQKPCCYQTFNISFLIILKEMKFCQCFQSNIKQYTLYFIFSRA